MAIAPQFFSPRRRDASGENVEDGKVTEEKAQNDLPAATAPSNNPEQHSTTDTSVPRTTTITFDPSVDQRRDSATLYIPGPQDRDRGLLLAICYLPAVHADQKKRTSCHCQDRKRAL